MFTTNVVLCLFCSSDTKVNKLRVAFSSGHYQSVSRAFATKKCKLFFLITQAYPFFRFSKLPEKKWSLV
jgi:hypothetical protein